jgi:hypothetical protein
MVVVRSHGIDRLVLRPDSGYLWSAMIVARMLIAVAVLLYLYQWVML